MAALLDDVMLSFMETAGWRLLVSEQELLANAHEPWETVNSLFAYEGPDPAGPFGLVQHYPGLAADRQPVDKPNQQLCFAH